MTTSEFRRVPLLRRFPQIDEATGDLFMHEVRKDPASGLTITAKFPIPPLERSA